MEAYEEAEAALAAWGQPLKIARGHIGYDRLESLQLKYRKYRFTPEGTKDEGCLQPLAAPSCPDELISPKKDAQPRVEPSSVSVELTEAISKGTTKVTDKLLNISYEQYLADPIQELDNLKVAVFAHVRTGYYKAVDDLIKGGMMGFEEISYDFSAHVVRKLQAGKYPDHDGKLANWVAKCWPRYCSSYKQAFYKEQKDLVGVNTFEVRDPDKDVRIECKSEYVDIRDVEEQQYKRENAGPYLKHTGYDNSPKQRVEAIMRDLDDPTTRFGQLDADMKAIIRELWKGNSVTEVGKSVGLGRRQVDRKLKALRELKLKALRERKSHSFLHVSPNHLMHTDDVVKGGRLYTVRVEDFEREVAR